VADISSYLAKILEAVYGEEVRGSIHDALAAMNVESNQAMNDASTAKDSAKASAAEAKASEGKAKTSEENAKSSESNAAASEANVAAAEGRIATSEVNARTYAANAKSSEESAEESASTATKKATDAGESKAAAAQSEANALAAEERTKAVRDDVEKLGAQATQDKNDAEAARDAASASKTAAGQSATNAATSATEAGKAKTAAETAQGKAEDAQKASEDAQTAAETAQGKAEDAEAAAKSSEESAKKSAETAQQYSGNPSKPIDGSWWIWNAETGKYEDTGITCELVGPTGNGIASMELTSGDHSPGSVDVYSITMTDGTVVKVPVYHGKNGTGTGDIIGIAFDLTIPVESWNKGLDCTIEDEHLIASAKYKYLLDAYDDSKTEVKECNVIASDIKVDGSISFTADITPINPITVNIVRLEMGANAVQG
jgi:hypothetical protein